MSSFISWDFELYIVIFELYLVKEQGGSSWRRVSESLDTGLQSLYLNFIVIGKACLRERFYKLEVSQWVNNSPLRVSPGLLYRGVWIKFQVNFVKLLSKALNQHNKHMTAKFNIVFKLFSIFISIQSA